MKSYKTVNELYDTNWRMLEGLQMAPMAAETGYQWIKELKKIKKCLDLGCGDGTNGIRIKDLGLKVDGAEISEFAVKKARKKGINAKQVDLNTPRLPYKDDSYDLVWLSDVIEHVFWPDQLLSEINRITAKNGYLFLTTPNVSWFINRLLLLSGKTLRDIHPEHIIWFNRDQLYLIIENSGFKIIRAKAYRRYLPYPLTQKFPFLDRINTVDDADRLFSYTYIILAKKTK